MVNENQQSNHEKMATRLREYYDYLVLTEPELADSWTENPELSEIPDPDQEPDFDPTPGAYDDWEAKDGWDEEDDDEDFKESSRANLLR